jgi:KipI family sensor histidine kinase inhibitor
LSNYSLTYKPFGKSAILVEWPAEMSESVLEDILSFQQIIQASNSDGIIEIIQSIHSLTIVYNSDLWTFGELKNWLEKYYFEAYKKQIRLNFLWKIPVCYHLSFGLDFQEITRKNSLSIQEIIEIHSQTTYQIYSIGFLPGFLYLGGLNQRLYIDRKANPRLATPKGSVGIGGKQTGIYPTESSGGWQIIGNTPISLFDVKSNPPCFAKAGDKVQFIPISKGEHEQITKLVSTKSYQIKKEVLNG